MAIELYICIAKMTNWIAFGILFLVENSNNLTSEGELRLEHKLIMANMTNWITFRILVSVEISRGRISYEIVLISAGHSSIKRKYQVSSNVTAVLVMLH